MHEVAIADGVMTLVSAKQKELGFNKVLEVHIACGMYNCLSEESLNFALQAASSDTCLEGALIKVRRLPERWKCLGCRKEFFKEDNKANLDTRCTHCAGMDVVPRPNSDIYLDKLEVV